MSASSAVPVDSKSGKKRKSKTEAVAVASPAGRASPSVDSGLNGHTVEPTTAMDSPYLKEIAKNIRNLHKKLNSSAKADSVVEQNPNISLDDLVAQKKLNADQKAQLVKKPQLQAQLAQLEEQQKHYTTFAQELQDKFDKEKAALVESHEAQLAQAKQEASDSAATNKTDDTEKSLTVITGFLHAAAAKRQSEDQDSEEAKAFEGALLLVYQGNAQSLNTLKSLVEGSEEKVIDVEGNTLDFTFAQISEAALKDASVLVDEVETTPTIEETPDGPDTDPVADPATDPVTDPTIAHAGLTELEDTTTVPITSNGDIEVEEETAAPNQTSAGEEASNAVADATWDPQASITSTQTTGDEYVMVPRDLAETETPSHAPAVQQSTSNWADETAAEEKAAPENDGFEQVKRERGRGRGGPRGGRGFEGRGRGNRGRGEYRGGEHRGGEHRGGEYRGRGGQGRGGRGGRGARGDTAPQATPAPQAS